MVVSAQYDISDNLNLRYSYGYDVYSQSIIMSNDNIHYGHYQNKEFMGVLVFSMILMTI